MEDALLRCFEYATLQVVEAQRSELFPLVHKFSCVNKALAAAARKAAHTTCAPVLISWEHCRIPSLLIALGCESDACTRCWPDGVYDTFVALDVGAEPPVAHLRAEGFRRHEPRGFDAYECAGPERIAHSRCRFADGTWLGDAGSRRALAANATSDAAANTTNATSVDTAACALPPPQSPRGLPPQPSIQRSQCASSKFCRCSTNCNLG